MPPELTLALLCLVVGGFIAYVIADLINLRRRRELDADYRQRLDWAHDQLANERDRADRAVDLLAKISGGGPISRFGVEQRQHQEAEAAHERRAISEIFATEVGQPPEDEPPSAPV